jgi:hypothetical protein
VDATYRYRCRYRRVRDNPGLALLFMAGAHARFVAALLATEFSQEHVTFSKLPPREVDSGDPNGYT